MTTARIDPVRRAREYLRYADFLEAKMPKEGTVHHKNACLMTLGYHAMALALTGGKYKLGECHDLEAWPANWSRLDKSFASALTARPWKSHMESWIGGDADRAMLAKTPGLKSAEWDDGDLSFLLGPASRGGIPLSSLGPSHEVESVGGPLHEVESVSVHSDAGGDPGPQTGCSSREHSHPEGTGPEETVNEQGGDETEAATEIGTGNAIGSEITEMAGTQLENQHEVAPSRVRAARRHNLASFTPELVEWWEWMHSRGRIDGRRMP
ncbi:hypothetical protein QBC47DRAFT_407811 [Echria macrotheca]|uniref:Uncharacterized protein n=1 Tax=Echria macrotheca TaxID=438768 RepID=A0AAJ0B0U6_9PEZI|nr:hypothetical protein QBC47DRAFT_407811 [Echria macrotheca]